MSIRITALAACVTAALSIIWPLWTMIESVSKVPAQAALFAVIPILSAVIAPVFYFALWQNKSALAIDRSLRNLALVAAVIEGVLIAISAQSFIASINQYLIRVRAFGFGADPESIQFAASVLGEASNVAAVLLLIAFYKAPDLETAEPQSSFLEIASRAAVMICGLLVVFNLLQMGYAPRFFWEMHEQIARASDEQRSQFFRDFWLREISRVFAAFSVFAAPYIVSMSRRFAAPQVPAEPLSEENDPGIEALDQPS